MKNEIEDWFVKGSMTIEAIFVISFIVLIIFWILQETIFLYQETAETTEKVWLHLEETASVFRKLFLQKELLQ